MKVKVSNNLPVFNDKNENICRSEGTGFLISSNYAITAAHVFKLNNKCLNPIITVNSRLPGSLRLAEIIDSYNDVALLKIKEPLPSRFCALRVLSSDVYASKGLRFGIPHDLQDAMAVPIDIGEKDNEFAPSVVLTPPFTEPGESGGPVIYQFNVVGMTRAKSETHPGYSFMEAAGNIRFLMRKNGVKNDGKTCNPAELFMFDAEAGGSGVGLQVTDGVSERLSSKIIEDAASALAQSAASDPNNKDLIISKTADTLFIQRGTANKSELDPSKIEQTITPQVEKSIWDDYLNQNR
ncbi:S1 family peptidase [Methylobacterium terrae]|uniref:S1 family peptidase n=1 Tax=Methylobacterium terrae TaxID=2202827 RepID=UPI0013A5BACB|nr:serine protease [Methylobacterium terrae]